MTKKQNSKQYDLEERTLKFAKQIRAFVKKLKRTIANIEDGRQLINASGSVGANYIEANEALSKKDFFNAYQDMSEGSQRKCLLAETCRL